MTMQGGLARCKFCERTFANKQAVKAHLKGCVAYRQRLPRQIERKATRAATTATSAPYSQMHSKMNLTEDQSKIISAVIDEAIEKDCALRYGVPQDVKAQAIMEIRQELSYLHLNEFTFDELLETAEGIRDGVYDSLFQTLDAPARRELNAENVARRKREVMRRTLERIGEEKATERRRTARIASAVQYAERQLANAPGMDIWNRWLAMQEVRGSLGHAGTGTESSADLEKLADHLLIPFLKEGAHRAIEERKVKLIEFGKQYAQEELNDDEDMNFFERTATVDKVRQALATKLKGDETKTQVEDLVEYLLDEEVL